MIEDARVADLIDQGAHCWKQPLLVQTFIPEEVQAIKAIPLSIIDKEDILVWSPVKNDIFFVKSTYHFHHSMYLSKKGTSSTDNISPIAWKSIQKLNVPNRIKIFIWKACKEILSTFLNLMKKRIINSELFPICLHHAETTFDSIWDCEASKDVWSLSCHRLQKYSFLNISFLDLWI